MDPEELKQLSRSLNSRKGFLTKACARATEYLKTFKPEQGLNPGPEHLVRIKALLAEMVNQKDKTEASFAELEKYTEPTREEQLTGVSKNYALIEKQMDTFHKTSAEIQEILGKIELQAKSAGSKSDEALRPTTKLTLKFTATQLEQFITQLKAYFNCTHYANSRLPTQRAVAYNLIDGELLTMLKSRETELTTVFAEDEPTVNEKKVPSLETMIRDAFLTAYPRCQRKMDLFKFRQSGNTELFQTFVSRFETVLQTAEFDKMNLQEIKKYLFVSSIVNEDLRKEIIKTETEKGPACTYEDLLEVGRKFDLTNSTIQSYAKVKAAKNEAKGTRSKTDDKGKKDKADKGKKKKCFRCGKEDHKPDDCRHKTTKCRYCEKQGHIDSACYKKQKAEGKDDKAGKGGATPATPAPKVAASLVRVRQALATVRTPCSDSQMLFEALNEQFRLNKKFLPKLAQRRVGEVRILAAGKRKPKASASMPTPVDAEYDEVGLPVVERALPTPPTTVRVIPKEGQAFDLTALPDSGAQITMIAEDIANRFGLPKWPSTIDMVGIEEKPGEPGLTVYDTCPIILAFGSRRVVVRNAKIGSFMHPGTMCIDWQSLQHLRVIPVINQTPDDVVSIDLIEAGSCGPLEALMAKYPDVFVDTLDESKAIKGPKMHVHMKTDIPVRPLNISSTKAVPINLQKAADQALEGLISAGIIKPIEPGKVTTWCSRGFWVPKGDGKSVRLVTDYVHLNRYVRRPVHPFMAAYHCLMSIPPHAEVFIAADACQGYHQIELDEESSLLTTFLLPQGRFRYLRAPMGLSASSDEWCSRSDACLVGADNAIKLVDDILTFGKDLHEAVSSFEVIVRNCSSLGICLSKKKLVCGEKVKFAGFMVSKNGVEPHPDTLAAIKQFPEPEDRTAVRSFLGLANTLGKFIPDMNPLCARMRELTKDKVHFLWLPEHQKDFDRAKDILTGPLLVRHYDPDMVTELITDASRLHGLGFVLLQHDGKDPKRYLIMAGSRPLTSAERNYATCEIECMGIVFGCEKASHYLLGCELFHVLTDHNPLLGVFRKPLSEVGNARLLRLRERLAKYNFELSYIEGKKNLIADSLSRYPINFSAEPDVQLSGNDTVIDESRDLAEVRAVFALTAADDPSFQCIYDNIDSDYADLIAAIRAGLHESERKTLPGSHALRRIVPAGLWPHLSVVDGLVVLNAHRVVVPRNCVSEILSLLHEGHPGISKMARTARRFYYWAGMSKDCQNEVAGCPQCQLFQPSKPHANMGEEGQSIPTGPMHRVNADMAEHAGKDYLVFVDAWSGFPWVQRVTSTTSSALINAFERVFSEAGFGYPQILRTDGARNFESAEVKQWCAAHGIRFETSSPYNHEANGQAEVTVKTVKALLDKADGKWDTFRDSLLAFRITCRPDGYSPSDLFFARVIKTKLPVLPVNLEPNVAAQVEGGAKRLAQKQGTYDHSGAEKQHLERFKVGVKVFLQNPLTHLWDTTGVIEEICASRRTFMVKDQEGVTRRRNLRFLRIVPDAYEAKQAGEISAETEPKSGIPKIQIKDDVATQRPDRQTKAKMNEPRRSERLQAKSVSLLRLKRKGR